MNLLSPYGLSLFYKEYFHDDLSENIGEVVNDFKRIKLLLEDEFDIISDIQDMSKRTRNGFGLFN